MEQDLRIIADLVDHPFDPFHTVETVHGSETDIGSLAFPVGALIYEQHPETVVEIVIGKTAVIIYSLTRVPVETDHRLISAVALKICTVQLQTVMGSDPYILMGLFHHPVMALMHEREVFFPVYA